MDTVSQNVVDLSAGDIRLCQVALVTVEMLLGLSHRLSTEATKCYAPVRRSH